MDFFENLLEDAFVIDEWNEGDDDDDDDEEEEKPKEEKKIVEDPSKQSLNCDKNNSKHDLQETKNTFSQPGRCDENESKNGDVNKINSPNENKVKFTDLVEIDKNKDKGNLMKQPVNKNQSKDVNVKQVFVKQSVTDTTKNKSKDDVKKIEGHSNQYKINTRSSSKRNNVNEIRSKTQVTISDKNKSKENNVKKSGEHNQQVETVNKNKNEDISVKKIEELKAQSSKTNKTKANLKETEESVEKLETSAKNMSNSDNKKAIMSNVIKVEPNNKSANSDKIKECPDVIENKVEIVQQLKMCNKNIRLKENILEAERRILQQQIQLCDGSTSDVCNCFKDNNNVWRYTCNPCNVRDRDWNYFSSHIKSRNHANLLHLLGPMCVKNEIFVQNETETSAEWIDSNGKTIVVKMEKADESMEMKEIKDIDKLKIANVDESKELIEPIKIKLETDKLKTLDQLRKSDKLLEAEKNKLNDSKVSEKSDSSSTIIEVNEKTKDFNSDIVNECKKVEHLSEIKESDKLLEAKENKLNDSSVSEKAVSGNKIMETDDLKMVDQLKKLNNSNISEKADSSSKTIETNEKTSDFNSEIVNECEIKETEMIMSELNRKCEVNKTNELKKSSESCDANELQEESEPNLSSEVVKEDNINKLDEPLDKTVYINETNVLKETDQEIEIYESKKINNIHKQNNNKNQTICRIQSKLDTYAKPVIGLEYLLEIVSDGPVYYYCMLCEKKGEDSSFISHFSKQKHYTQYLTLFFHAAADKLNLFYKIGKNHDLFYNLTEHVVARIEHVLGRLQPLQTRNDKFVYNRFSILESIEKGKHLRETSEQNFVECINASHLEEGNCTVGWKGKLNPSTPITQQKRDFSGDGVSNNKSISDRVSQFVGFGQPFKPDIGSSYFQEPPKGCNRAQNPVCLTLQEIIGNTEDPSHSHRFEERRFYNFASSIPDLLKNYEERVKQIEENLLNDFRFYQETPEKHPFYVKEWHEYCSRKNLELVKNFEDPDNKKLLADWFEFWDTRLKEWFQEIFQMDKTELRQQLRDLHYEERGSMVKTSSKDPYKWIKPGYDSSRKPNSILSVILILKNLSSLNNILGPLAPRIGNLLSSALMQKNFSENGAEGILLDKENCAILKEARERLEVYQRSDCVQYNLTSKVKTAILNIIDLLRSVSGRQHDDRQLLCTKEIFFGGENFSIESSKSTTFKVSELNQFIDKVGFLSHIAKPERTAIVQEIASELFLRGLTEITEDNLLQLKKVLTPRDKGREKVPGYMESPLGASVLTAIELVFGKKQDVNGTKRFSSSSVSSAPGPKISRKTSPLKVRCKRRSKKLKNRKDTLVPDFINTPYKFWVKSNAVIGSIVGQVKVNEAMHHHTLEFSLLHGYHKGVPFAIELNTGTVSVVDHLKKYNRMLFNLKVVVIDEKGFRISTEVVIRVESATDFISPPVPGQEDLLIHNPGKWVNSAPDQVFEDQHVFPGSTWGVQQHFVEPGFSKQNQAHLPTSGWNNMGPRAPLRCHPSQSVSVLQSMNQNASNNFKTRIIRPAFNTPNQGSCEWNNIRPIPQAHLSQRKSPEVSAVDPVSSNSSFGSNLKVVMINDRNNIPISDEKNNIRPITQTSLSQQISPIKTAVDSVSSRTNVGSDTYLRVVQISDQNKFPVSDERNNIRAIPQTQLSQQISPVRSAVDPFSSTISIESNFKVIKTSDQNQFPISDVNKTRSKCETMKVDTVDYKSFETGFDEEEIQFSKKIISGPGSLAMKKYIMRMDCIESKLIKDFRFFQDNPHKHEQYQKELDLFWNKRKEPPTIENRWDIIKNEFVPHWNILLKQLYQDKFKLEKSKIRNEFIKIYFDKPLDKDVHCHQDKKLYCAKSPSRKYDKVRVRSKDTQHIEPRKRSYSPYRSERSSCKRRLSCSREPSIRRRLSRSRERSKGNYSLDKKDSSPHKRKKVYSKKRSTDRRRQSEEFQTENKNNSKDKISIVPVLRYITVLEKYLDSLGPKVLDLLSEALSLEKLNDNVAIRSFIKNNSVLLDTIKEKLIGLIEAKIIEYALENVAKNAITKIDSLLSKVQHMPVAEKVTCKSNKTSVVDSGKINKKSLKITEIASFIENHEKLSHLTYIQKVTISQAVGTSLIYQNILEVTEEDTMVLVQAAINKLNFPLIEDSCGGTTQPSANFNKVIVKDYKPDSNISHEDLSLSKLPINSFDKTQSNFQDYKQQSSNYSQYHGQVSGRDSSIINIEPEYNSLNRLTTPAIFVNMVQQPFSDGNQPVKNVHNNTNTEPLFPAYVSTDTSSCAFKYNPHFSNTQPPASIYLEFDASNFTQTCSNNMMPPQHYYNNYAQGNSLMYFVPQAHHSMNYNKNHSN